MSLKFSIEQSLLWKKKNERKIDLTCLKAMQKMNSAAIYHRTLILTIGESEIYFYFSCEIILII